MTAAIMRVFKETHRSWLAATSGVGVFNMAWLEYLPGHKPPEDLWQWRARVRKERTTVRAILTWMFGGIQREWIRKMYFEFYAIVCC